MQSVKIKLPRAFSHANNTMRARKNAPPPRIKIGSQGFHSSNMGLRLWLDSRAFQLPNGKLKLKPPAERWPLRNAAKPMVSHFSKLNGLERNFVINSN